MQRKLSGLVLAVIFIFASLAVYSQNYCQKCIEICTYKRGIYVVSIDKDYFARNSDIYAAESLETVESVAKKNDVKVAINAGFFDPANAKTISYIYKDGEEILNPRDNERLTSSEELKPYLEKIFNRTEFRVLCCSDDIKVDIQPHNAPISKNCGILYSIQAGPSLIPDLALEKEFFVLKKDNIVVRESASVLHKVARSAIGIKNNRIIIVAATNKSPMTLQELAEFMKKQGIERAMAFDGGSSTSLYVDIPEEKKRLNLNSAKDNSARKVKTILIVK
jgi:exopolysaccharide biosynthesis protein